MTHQLVKKATIQPHTNRVYGCSISPDGTLVATVSWDKTLCITNIATQAKVWDVAWSPDGTHLVAVTESGNVVQVTNRNAHSTVYEINTVLLGCAFSPSGIVAVGGADIAVTLLDPSKNYSVIQTFTGLSNIVRCLAFSPAGNLLAAGCENGHMYIYGLTNGKWAQVFDVKHHSDQILSLSFSPSGRMLLVASYDKTASIWNVPSGTTWSFTPHVTLKGHTSQVCGGAFVGDESHVITGSKDKSLFIWRTSDGVQTANYESENVTSLSYHSASGNIIVGLSGGQVEMWQTEPYIALPAHECVRERLVEAQAQANDIQALLEKADSGLRQQMSREQEMKRSIADLEAKCALISDRIIIMDTKMRLVANEKKALEEMQTAEYIAQSRNFTKLMERHNELLGIIHGCTQTLDSLTDCLSVSGLEDLRAAAFKEWLCDIGLGKLQTTLKDIDGNTLTMLHVEHVMENDVSFNDAAALQLRGYIAHYKLSNDSAFAPPRGSVLSWDQAQTANWIASLGAPYGCLSSAGWHGAALCSLSPPRVVEAGAGKLKASDAAKLIGLVRQMRKEVDGDKATWMSKWNGTTPIDNQA